MVNLWTNRGLRTALVLAIALGTWAVWADTTAAIDDPVVFSGPITALSATSLTVQGVEVALAPTTQVFGLDTSGALVTVDPASLLVNDSVTIFAQDADGTATADLILVGLGFHLKGQVTAFVMGSGGPTQVTLDGIYDVDVSNAVWLSPEDGRAPRRRDAGGGSIQVGSEVEFWGLADNGGFAAAFAKLESGGGPGGGAPTVDNGFILALTSDSQGVPTGFTMTSRGSIATVALGPSTQITGKGSGNGSLQAGVHVKVWGTLQSDGSVLASQVIIKGGMRH